MKKIEKPCIDMSGAQRIILYMLEGGSLPVAHISANFMKLDWELKKLTGRHFHNSLLVDHAVFNLKMQKKIKLYLRKDWLWAKLIA